MTFLDTLHWLALLALAGHLAVGGTSFVEPLFSSSYGQESGFLIEKAVHQVS